MNHLTHRCRGTVFWGRDNFYLTIFLCNQLSIGWINRCCVRQSQLRLLRKLKGEIKCFWAILSYKRLICERCYIEYILYSESHSMKRLYMWTLIIWQSRLVRSCSGLALVVTVVVPEVSDVKVIRVVPSVVVVTWWSVSQTSWWFIKSYTRKHE